MPFLSACITADSQRTLRVGYSQRYGGKAIKRLKKRRMDYVLLRTLATQKNKK
jgi:hypothetical protein